MNPATTGGNVWSVGTIGPDGLELGTDASPAGPCKTVSVNRIGAVNDPIASRIEVWVACHEQSADPLLEERREGGVQAALEHLATPMPFLTGRFRACASGSRTA